MISVRKLVIALLVGISKRVPAEAAEADEAWRLADDFYQWSLLRTKQWAADTEQEERELKERKPAVRRESGPLGHALHEKWPHEL